MEMSAKTRVKVDEVFSAAIRVSRQSADSVVSVRVLARELVLLVLLAQRFDLRSAFHRVPRDVVALIGRRVLFDAAFHQQRAHWDHAIEARRDREAKKGTTRHCAMY